MRISKSFISIAVAGFMAISNISHAAVYDFGKLLTASSGYSAPDSFASAPFAHLAANDIGGGVWNFMLSVQNNFFSNFGDGAFIGSISFDFTPDPYGKPKSSFISSNRGGVTSVSSTSGNGLSGLTDIDFGTNLGRGSNNRLSENDWVRWSVSGLNIGSSLSNMYLKVQGIDGGYCLNGDYSAKYTPVTSPVPEPETYAMILAGLGLIAFTARRRKDNS